MYGRMNKSQIIIMWVAGLLVVLACLLPPWDYTYQTQGISQVRTAASYSSYWSIFHPPWPKGNTYRHGVSVDLGRLAVLVLSISVVGGMGIVTAGRVSRQEPS